MVPVPSILAIIDQKNSFLEYQRKITTLGGYLRIKTFLNQPGGEKFQSIESERTSEFPEEITFPSFKRTKLSIRTRKEDEPKTNIKSSPPKPSDGITYNLKNRWELDNNLTFYSMDIPIQVTNTSNFSTIMDPEIKSKVLSLEFDYSNRSIPTAIADGLRAIESNRTIPTWKVSGSRRAVAWDVHTYLTGSLFVVLSAYSIFGLIRLRTFTHLFTQGYFVALNFLTLILGITRAVYLLYDPYNSRKKYPSVVALFLYNIAQPCLTSAFAILFLALLRVTRTGPTCPKLQKPNVLAGFVSLHLLLSIGADIVVGTVQSSFVVGVVCQIIFSGWAVFLCLCYFLSFRKLYVGALKKQGEMMRVTFTKLHIDGGDLPNKLPKPTIALSVKITLVVAVMETILAGLQIYEILFVNGLLLLEPQFWFWWTYHLSSRIMEFVAAATMSFVSTQPIRHFESGERCCKCSVRLGCGNVRSCWRSDKFDFETHSHYYANPRSIGSANLMAAVGAPRRWSHTNSLPTFRSLPTQDTDILPEENFLRSKWRERGSRAHTLMPCRRPARTFSLSTYEESDGVQRRDRGSGRPPSMLFKENGFVRFRTETDPPQSMEESEDDDEDNVSIRANAGSSIQSLTDEDVVQNSISPFFHSCYRSRFKSKCSLATTDNSGDLSVDQLNQKITGHCLSNSTLDPQVRKYGSTCSSESAANSFDVTFYLHTPLRPPEGFESDVSSIEAHEAMLRSASPVAFASVWRTPELPLNLDLDVNINAKQSESGNKDITPDSAVCLDQQLPPPSSHSLGDLTRSQKLTSLSQPSKTKRMSRSFLSKLKGSTFSLNAAINGYELLQSEESRQSPYQAEANKARNKVQRSSSDRRPSSVQDQRFFASLADMRIGSASYGHLCHVDSGMLGDYAANENVASDLSAMTHLVRLTKDAMHVSD